MDREGIRSKSTIRRRDDGKILIAVAMTDTKAEAVAGEASTAAPLRRGTRTRQITKRAGESAQQAAEEQRVARTSTSPGTVTHRTRSRSRSEDAAAAPITKRLRSASPDKKAAGESSGKPAPAVSSRRKSSSGGGGGGSAARSKQQGQRRRSSARGGGDKADEDGEESDGERYCVCRGKDLGTPMVECSQCNDW